MNTATPEIYTLPLPDLLPIYVGGQIRQIALHLGGGGHRRAVCQAALGGGRLAHRAGQHPGEGGRGRFLAGLQVDRKSTRLNSSHGYISYAVFCLKKKIPSRTA